jgi:hypothetical protein
MAIPVKWICIAIAVLILLVLFFFVFIENSVDETQLLATPTIPKDEAAFTSFASVKIQATAEEVFAVVLNFTDYGSWNTSTPEITWDKTTADGVPFVGAKGVAKV